MSFDLLNYLNLTYREVLWPDSSGGEAVGQRADVPSIGGVLRGKHRLQIVQVAEAGEAVQLPVVDYAEETVRTLVHQTERGDVSARVLVVLHVHRLQVERGEQIVVILAQLLDLLGVLECGVNAIAMNVQNQISFSKKDNSVFIRESS